MKPRRRLFGAVAAALLAAVPVVLVAPLGSAAAATATVSSRVCRSPAHPGLAARLSRDIQAAWHGRVSEVAVRVDDPGQKLGCWLHGARRFDSASVVKVTILGALLRKALDQHRYLTDTEDAQASAMITRSDNDAASALWYELGPRYLQHFLILAGMKHTILGAGGYWGLTKITAHDEVVLLRLLLHKNPVLNLPSRRYALGLMTQVIASQRWGVPAGAPARLTVHVKNGWMPLAPHGWRINSIGCFTGRRRGYSIVVLTQNNPTLGDGIATIETIAKAIHRDLNR
jgi:beta-lactamase class A